MVLARRWAGQDLFDGPVYAAAAKYGVDPALVKAVIATESGFQLAAYNPNDPGGAWGLMQVIESTARWLGYAGPMPALLTDPVLAIDLGTKYLGHQVQRYGGSVADTAAAYNAGSARQVAGAYVNQVYVDRVLERFRYFVAWEAEKGGPGVPAGGFPGRRVDGSDRAGPGAALEETSTLEAGRGAVDPDAGSPLSSRPSPPFPLLPPPPAAALAWVRRASDTRTSGGSMRGSKLFGWIGLLTGLAGVIADAAQVVGSTAAQVATVIGLVLAALGGSISRPADQRASDHAPR